jgi:hypothetical protein
MARKIAEIKKDLAAATEALGNVDVNDVDARNAAVAKVRTLMAEHDAAAVAEEAEQMLAERSFRNKEKQEKRKFSVLKFINEVATDSLSGLELDAAQEGAKEYDRLVRDACAEKGDAVDERNVRRIARIDLAVVGPVAEHHKREDAGNLGDQGREA